MCHGRAGRAKRPRRPRAAGRRLVPGRARSRRTRLRQPWHPRGAALSGRPPAGPGRQRGSAPAGPAPAPFPPATRSTSCKPGRRHRGWRSTGRRNRNRRSNRRASTAGGRTSNIPTSTPPKPAPPRRPICGTSLQSLLDAAEAQGGPLTAWMPAAPVSRRPPWEYARWSAGSELFRARGGGKAGPPPETLPTGQDRDGRQDVAAFRGAPDTPARTGPTGPGRRHCRHSPRRKPLV